MRKAALVGTMVALCAGAARADFVVTGYGYAGPVNDVYEIYALDNGANGTGTRAVSDDVTLTDFSPGFPPHLAAALSSSSWTTPAFRPPT